ncbi:tail assembly chaperone [Erwinia phage Faunus]|uniref:Uncharacterized protein n=1 Tax=Erwinia phage Faunus TaxID=2182346 RepID=A0A2U8UWL1_9CAUD|nr:tail assembly chaperone [Erwinia phage Faunus]AWN08645.1 hypothetical protein [Erwinia phage Faunus]
MACELLTREFEDDTDGKKFVITTRQLSASNALDLYVELMNKVGGSVLPLINDDYNFGDLLSVMRANPDNKVVTELIKRVICSANMEGAEIQPALFNNYFSGRLMLSMKVFAFVLEANFKEFFRQGRALNEQRSLEAADRLKQQELNLMKSLPET